MMKPGAADTAPGAAHDFEGVTRMTRLPYHPGLKEAAPRILEQMRQEFIDTAEQTLRQLGGIQYMQDDPDTTFEQPAPATNPDPPARERRTRRGGSKPIFFTKAEFDDF